jgi:C4-dicarboxylate transporter DctM subunit
MDLAITFGLILALFVLLGSGIWIGLALLGVGWLGMELFTPRRRRRDGRHHLGRLLLLDPDRPADVPLDGRDPVPHAALLGHVQGPRALAGKPAGPPAARQRHRLHIFAAVSGSSAATCATIGKITLPELASAAIPRASPSAPWPAPARWAC